jgi:hypothetical protein
MRNRGACSVSSRGIGCLDQTFVDQVLESLQNLRTCHLATLHDRPAASSVNPPTNTDSARNTAGSSLSNNHSGTFSASPPPGVIDGCDWLAMAGPESWVYLRLQADRLHDVAGPCTLSVTQLSSARRRMR